jgi:hypothetical protein
VQDNFSDEKSFSGKIKKKKKICWLKTFEILINLMKASAENFSQDKQ